MEYKIKLAYHNMEEIKELFQEYTKSLGFDLQFQNYEQEYKNLPGKYNVPKGRLYLLECNNQPAGCIALKPFQKDICEIKRLYIKEEYRGYRFGEKLMKKVIQDAQEIGYHQIYLDTLDFMKSAIHVYQKLGFQEFSGNICLLL